MRNQGWDPEEFVKGIIKHGANVSAKVELELFLSMLLFSH